MTRNRKNDDVYRDISIKEEDDRNIDIDTPKGCGYPVIERTNNALIWPEGIKGRIDITDSYEVSSVPEDPGTPMETPEFLQRKKVTP